MWKIGKKTDHNWHRFEDNSAFEDGWQGAGDTGGLTRLKAAIADRFGGSDTDYTYYHLSAQEETRVKNGDENAPTWTGDEITAIDFSQEDAKKYLRFSVSKTEAMCNGIDKAMVTVTMYNNTDTAIDTTFDGSINISLRGPTKQKVLRLRFVKGIAQRAILPNESGSYSLPSDKIAGYRIHNTINFKGVE